MPQQDETNNRASPIKATSEQGNIPLGMPVNNTPNPTSLRIRLPPRPPPQSSSNAQSESHPLCGDYEQPAPQNLGNEETDPAMECVCGEPRTITMVRCHGPACGQWVSAGLLLCGLYHSHNVMQFHQECAGLNSPQSRGGDWFCDNDCRRNAGVPVRRASKRRRIDS